MNTTIQAAMNERGLKPKDLLDIFKTRGRASEIIRGLRAVPKSMAIKLSERLGVPLETIISETQDATPIPVTTIRYKCPFCSKSWSGKQSAIRHIERCWHNPASRSCKTCEHYCPYVPPWRGDPQDFGETESCSEGVVDFVSRDPKEGLVSNCEKWIAREAEAER